MLTREECEQLFEETMPEVVTASARTSIELDINQLQQFTPAEHEHLAILFDLAHEELDTPSSGKRYLELEDIRARHRADTSTLTKALHRFERIVQAPFSLKAKPPSAISLSSSYRQPIARAALKVVSAEPRARLSALAIDLTVSSLLAVVVAALLSPLIEGELLAELQITSTHDILGYVPLLALYFKVLLLVIMFYPAALLLLRGRTPGLVRNRIKLVSTNGAPPIPAQIIVRALLTPLSLLLCSPIAILGRQKTVSDYLSRTTVSKI